MLLLVPILGWVCFCCCNVGGDDTSWSSWCWYMLEALLEMDDERDGIEWLCWRWCDGDDDNDDGDDNDDELRSLLIDSSSPHDVLRSNTFVDRKPRYSLKSYPSIGEWASASDLKHSSEQ